MGALVGIQVSCPEGKLETPSLLAGYVFALPDSVVPVGSYRHVQTAAESVKMYFHGWQ